MKSTFIKIIFLLFSIIILGILSLIVFNVFFNTPQRKVSKALGINASSGKILSHIDTHGGFHGDGYTYTVLQFSDDSYCDRIPTSAPWHSLPLSSSMQTILYGTTKNSQITSPLFTDDNGNPLFPKIENGFYYFKDRHSKSTNPFDDSAIWNRYSYNFTIAVYDFDTRTLYFGMFDT